MMMMPPAIDRRVMALLDHALDNDSGAAQLVIVQCFSSVFGAADWWCRMLADDPQIAALVRQANRMIIH